MAQAARIIIDQLSLITPELARNNGAEAARPDSQALKAAAGELALILNLALQGFQEKQPAASVVDRLAARLHHLRKKHEAPVWKELVSLAQQHPVAGYLMQDPFTRWSFDKPRGYSGDATLLDIYYRHPDANEIVSSSSQLGQEIYDYTSEAPSSAAGRERRDILAKTVDETSQKRPDAEVLAVACGHLREAELSAALASGQLKRWVGLDQDPASVNKVAQRFAGTAVRAIEGNVKGLLRRSYELGTFDLVYASGLYDYLTLAIGARLLQRMMELVKPGGELLLANFSDEITTDGYMETFMDWPLILRSADDMWAIVNSAVDRNRVDAEVFYGANRNIVYAKLRKHYL